VKIYDINYPFMIFFRYFFRATDFFSMNTPTKPLQQPFCTTREAANILGVSLRTVQLWSESGLLTAWKTHGGHRRVTLESIEKIRAKPSGAHAKTPSQVSSPVDPQFRILVAEDDTIFQTLYLSIIGGWDMRPKLTLAENGFDALVKIGQERPDLLITDLDMPGMDGFEMLRSLKAMPDLADLDVVVVTGLTDEEIARRDSLPVDVPVLHKPVRFDQLEQIVEASRLRRNAESVE